MSKVFVLYVDHQDHPAPLSSCYHATGSRRLSSALDRYPPSTLTEIDSAFCPQCLSFHDAASAARLGFCPKASCQRCPVCEGSCTLKVEQDKCFYRCGLCEWDSRGCGLTQTVRPEEDGTLTRVELERAKEELGTALKERRKAQQDVLDPHNKLVTAAWDARTKKKRDEKALSAKKGGAWSVEALESSLEDKRNKIVDADLPELVGIGVKKISLDEAPLALSDSLQDVSHVSLDLQALNSNIQSLTRNDLLPLPTPLRVRLSRRCRAELAEGRPGILLKPKLNPLEGDSSLRSGHGQWWKKDSSAIHVMPRIGVLKDEIKDNYRVFLLKVTNPTLGPVRLRFTSSGYQGEKDWDDLERRTQIIPDLLVDELQQTYLNLELKTNVLNQLETTDTVELLSAEDSFIELGGKAREIPDDVKNWEPLKDVSTPGASMMKLVACSTSTAFFELALADAGDASEVRAIAVPLAVQLEVGNGSWETSLIQSQASSTERDWVKFDLVIAWT